MEKSKIYIRYRSLITKGLQKMQAFCLNQVFLKPIGNKTGIFQAVSMLITLQ
ncbi:hypothetical protein QE357_003758 [Siphonobacter sp. BAB-5404]|nr:hypothetical protein [Siphonobacter sp. SORGH_AS_0500]